MCKVFFFCCAPLGAATFRRGQSKKKTPPSPTGFLLPLPFAGATAKKTHTLGGVYFLLWPRAGAQRGFSFPCLSPGPEQKKNTLVVLFFCSGPAERSRRPTGRNNKKNTLHTRGRQQKKFYKPMTRGKKGPQQTKKHPAGSRFCYCRKRPGGAAAKKKHHGVVFFFCCGPARTLTHSLRAWAAMRPRPDRGGVFFCCGPARTLTHSLWAGAISARPGWCLFFAAAPPGLFRQ